MQHSLVVATMTQFENRLVVTVRLAIDKARERSRFVVQGCRFCCQGRTVRHCNAQKLEDALWRQAECAYKGKVIRYSGTVIADASTDSLREDV